MQSISFAWVCFMRIYMVDRIRSYYSGSILLMQRGLDVLGGSPVRGRDGAVLQGSEWSEARQHARVRVDPNRAALQTSRDVCLP